MDGYDPSRAADLAERFYKNLLAPSLTPIKTPKSIITDLRNLVKTPLRGLYKSSQGRHIPYNDYKEST